MKPAFVIDTRDGIPTVINPSKPEFRSNRVTNNFLVAITEHNQKVYKNYLTQKGK